MSSLTAAAGIRPVPEDQVDPRRGAALAVDGARSLRGAVRLPGDKSISHRALMLALLADGRSTIVGLSAGADVASTRGVVEALGGRVVDGASRPGATEPVVVVESGGIDALHVPAEPLDCGNSGTTMRLFAGILAGQPFEATLDGDASLRSRPMARVAAPLSEMGARVRTHAGRPPISIRGEASLRAVEWAPEVASAQVKSAILLAGLRAAGTTRVLERLPTRDHTERMLRARGVTVRTTDADDGSSIVEIDGGVAIHARDQVVPGDASAAAFWLVAATAHSDAEIELRGVGLNPGRRTAIDILREMGASIVEAPLAAPDAAGPADDEPAADLRARSSGLRAVDVDARRTAAAIDEVPVLCLAATQADGITRLRGVGELRVKESDRLHGIVAGLTALGADIRAEGDDLRIAGPRPLRGAPVDGQDDHRLVMTFAIAGLLAAGRTTILGAASHAISDPGFVTELERIRP